MHGAGIGYGRDLDLPEPLGEDDPRGDAEVEALRGTALGYREVRVAGFDHLIGQPVALGAEDDQVLIIEPEVVERGRRLVRNDGYRAAGMLPDKLDRTRDALEPYPEEGPAETVRSLRA